MLDGKKILVTGGTGSFGKQFIGTVLDRYEPDKLIVFSRDELKQFQMQEAFPYEPGGPMRYFIGDIRDLRRLRFAMEGVDVVIHTAALKQVPAAEYNPFEAIKTNVLGAQNVIDAAIDAGVKKVIALSTDKATAPTSLYGATKLCSDKLFVSANNYSGMNNITFSVVRYGNVLGSRGSVIPYFLKKAGTGVLPITDTRMTRFSITLEEGVDFVLKCLDAMWGGELFVPKIPSYKITDVATAVCSKCRIEIVGIRPGEKLHEEMITTTDAINTLEYNDYFVIMPAMSPKWSVPDFQQNSNPGKVGQFVSEGFSYDSSKNEQFLSIDEIHTLIKTLNTASVDP
jgi:UDP-N-acetylglucosamine 4,6-dehydratase/5-epimerase